MPQLEVSMYTLTFINYILMSVSVYSPVNKIAHSHMEDVTFNVHFCKQMFSKEGMH